MAHEEKTDRALRDERRMDPGGVKAKRFFTWSDWTMGHRTSNLAAAFLLAVCLPTVLLAAELPTADELVTRSIDHHDPEGRFLSDAWCLHLRETRPETQDRRTEILVDVPGERFRMVRKAEHEVAGVLDGDRCETTLDGRSELTDEEREEHRLSCERLRFMRNYYVYLWGLPMKLRDPGTRLGEVEATLFMDEPVFGLRVTYASGVGDDVWYFYFDREDASLVGYRFYHDEAKNDGEYIVLEGEHEAHGMSLPASRAWYTHQDPRYLGTDILQTLEPCER